MISSLLVGLDFFFFFFGVNKMTEFWMYSHRMNERKKKSKMKLLSINRIGSCIFLFYFVVCPNHIRTNTHKNIMNHLFWWILKKNSVSMVILFYSIVPEYLYSIKFFYSDNNNENNNITIHYDCFQKKNFVVVVIVH